MKRNEGKLLAIVAADRADAALEIMQAHPLGQQAAIIGEVRAGRTAGSGVSPNGAGRHARA